jgi:predicted porin
MNKRLLAVAVAGALAAPAAAFAQSSVTISGVFKGGFESLKYSGIAAGNNSVSGVVDDSSRIIFNVTEDLGGGLQAIGQIDMRFNVDVGGAAATGGSVGATGNNHVGLRSKSWGRIFLGRQDVHYFNRESDLTVRGTLRADSISILSFAGGGGQSIAGATRTANIVHYTTPNWGGFTLIAAYSSNAKAQDADLAGAVRKGRAWHLNPNMAGANWQVGYSYWSGKDDGGGNAIATGNQRGDRLYGSYRWGGFKIGLAWDSSRIKGATNGLTLSKRSAWSIPASYSWGAHSVHAHYSKARSDKSSTLDAGSVQALNANADSGANMFALSYAYDLSKRTSIAATYARINNKAGAAYNFFTNVGLGLAGAAPAIGVDPRLWAVTLRHQF